MSATSPFHLQAPLIGGPKGLNDVPAFSDETIDELITGMEGMVAQGTPLEIPMAMPLAQLAGLTRTLRDLRARVRELEAVAPDLVASEPPLPDLHKLFVPSA